MSKQQITATSVALAVADHFLEHDTGATADDLAARLGCSVDTVRKRINESGGACRGTYCESEGRVSRSRSFPMFESGAHRINVYYPTLSALRDLVLAERALRVDDRRAVEAQDRRRVS